MKTKPNQTKTEMDCCRENVQNKLNNFDSIFRHTICKCLKSTTIKKNSWKDRNRSCILGKPNARLINGKWVCGGWWVKNRGGRERGIQMVNIYSNRCLKKHQFRDNRSTYQALNSARWGLVSSWFSSPFEMHMYLWYELANNIQLLAHKIDVQQHVIRGVDTQRYREWVRKCVFSCFSTANTVDAMRCHAIPSTASGCCLFARIS